VADLAGHYFFGDQYFRPDRTRHWNREGDFVTGRDCLGKSTGQEKFCLIGEDTRRGSILYLQLRYALTTNWRRNSHTMGDSVDRLWLMVEQT